MPATVPPRVTVAIPVYRRRDLLPAALRAVAAQDYPNLELIVSDNGGIGDDVSALVRAHYHGPYTFRRNDHSVPVIAHMNQLLDVAGGEYFVLLCDDDEVSPTFVSELVGRLECAPDAHVALGRAAIRVEGGEATALQGEWPERLTGAEFIRAWTTKRLRLASTITHVARTASVRACGGFNELPRGLYADNLLLLKLATRGDVLLGQGCTFTWRADATSTSYLATYREVARACRQFLDIIDDDPQIAEYAASRGDWPELRTLLRRHSSSLYLDRWRDHYRGRLSTVQWLRASLALPLIPAYYRDVWRTLADKGRRSFRRRAAAFGRPRHPRP